VCFPSIRRNAAREILCVSSSQQFATYVITRVFLLSNRIQHMQFCMFSPANNLQHMSLYVHFICPAEYSTCSSVCLVQPSISNTCHYMCFSSVRQNTAHAICVFYLYYSIQHMHVNVCSFYPTECNTKFYVL
jgi:hypothetical protein